MKNLQSQIIGCIVLPVLYELKKFVRIDTFLINNYKLLNDAFDESKTIT